MSRKFLTPPQLPSGATLPALGAEGDLFFKSDELKIFVHNGTEWVLAQGGGDGGNIDGGKADTNYGGIAPVEGGNASSF